MPIKNNPIILAISIISVCNEIDRSIPLLYIQCVLIIAMNPGITFTKLAKETDTPISSISRAVHALAENRQKGEPYRLVKITGSTTNKREKFINLTSEGEAFIKSLIKSCS